MKLLMIIALSLVPVLAQSGSTNAVPVDWRYYLMWDNPNGTNGVVSTWKIYATNSASGVRLATSSTTKVDILLVLNGAPAGAYRMYTTPISSLGDEGLPGTDYWVLWPGGNGKLKGGTNPRTAR